jgi:hypothetical protein
MKAARILGIIAMLATTGAVDASQADVETFKKLDASIQSVEAIVPPVPSWQEQAGPLWKGMHKSLSVLQSTAQNHSIPDQYRQDITNLASVLDELRRKSQSSQFWGVFGTSVIETCRAADKDLESKATHAKDNPSEPYGTVRVPVRTLRDEKEVSGYEVWYVTVAWESETNSFHRYKKFSSPTTENLNPGYYKMWSAKNGQSGTRVPVTVEEGRADPIDLTVPRD